ncbi:NAD(P)H-binding protein [Acetobacteraceae bacterium KSS8]|uniref:NAD(P)H-binding protein n=1 Tax=Endosaccharibacter trunci TaxID=2812733 RepID=A0ABT1W8J9_9PROT|nr:NAD(P)H-binding protein [Acetobacteraceae bacterium KSS8]
MPDPAPSPVHVIGASGRSGQALARRLIETGIEPVPVLRSAERWRATGLPLTPRIADLRDPAALRAALAGAKRIVSTAHARHAGAVLAAAPEDARFVFLGSTRKFTRWPDAHGNGVLAGETAFLRSGRSGVMLHPTMIYGAEGEDNVQRLAALLRHLPVVPLPGGGRALVQPIHQSDLTRAILASLDRPWDGPNALVACGPEPLRYRDFVREVTRAAGLRARPVLPLPAWLLGAAARPAGLLPGLPRIGPDEIRRLLEDKAFDVEPLRQRLGVSPMPLRDGLLLTFGSPTR